MGDEERALVYLHVMSTRPPARLFPRDSIRIEMNGTPLTAAGRRAAAAKLINFPLATLNTTSESGR